MRVTTIPQTTEVVDVFLHCVHFLYQICNMHKRHIHMQVHIITIGVLCVFGVLMFSSCFLSITHPDRPNREGRYSLEGTTAHPTAEVSKVLRPPVIGV